MLISTIVSIMICVFGFIIGVLVIFIMVVGIGVLISLRESIPKFYIINYHIDALIPLGVMATTSVISFIIFFDVFYGKYDSLFVHSIFATIGTLGVVLTLSIVLFWTIPLVKLLYLTYKRIQDNNNAAPTSCITELYSAYQEIQANTAITYYTTDDEKEPIALTTFPAAYNENSVIEEDDDLCILCEERKIRTVIVPCGHLVSCITCARQLTNNCPICKKKFLQIMRTYRVK